MYKILEDFPLYEINKDGHIRNRKRGTTVKPKLNSCGSNYIVVLYTTGGRFEATSKLKLRTVHRLVYSTFNSINYDDLLVFKFKDGNSLNYELDNLVYEDIHAERHINKFGGKYHIRLNPQYTLGGFDTLEQAKEALFFILDNINKYDNERIALNLARYKYLNKKKYRGVYDNFFRFSINDTWVSYKFIDEREATNFAIYAYSYKNLYKGNKQQFRRDIEDIINKKGALI